MAAAAATLVVLRRPGATRTDRRGRALNTEGVGVVEGGKTERGGGKWWERETEKEKERERSRRRRRFNVKGEKCMTSE